MQLILVNFNNVLGLNGSINFVEGKPLLVYGDNVSGKSNIINMMRYCLIPKLREKKGYLEEKRLKKNEILLKKKSTGSIEIYFQQKGEFYKLYYYFSRKGKTVSQAQKLFATRKTELPLEDAERINVMSSLEWEDLGTSSLNAFKEKLVDIGIYSEVLDILISPSNVRNFSEAINGSVVRVPELLAARISNMHDNSGKYLGNLQKLYGVIILEREESDRRTKELKNSLQEVSKNLKEIDVNKIFITSEIAKNLEGLQKSLTKQLESIPSTVGEMKKALGLLSSEKYEIWTSAIEQIVAVSAKGKELEDMLERKQFFVNLGETLKKWKTIFEGLPPDSHPEGLLTFSLPDYKKFDFAVFSNPEHMKSIFFTVDEAKDAFQKVSETCKKYRIPLETTEINNMIKSYSELLTALKEPLDPKGDPALISKRRDKVVISLPLDIAIKKMEYLRGIEPTPLIHRPEKVGKEEFQKEVTRLAAGINGIQKELRKAKQDMTDTKRLLKKSKQLREYVDREIKSCTANIQNVEKQSDSIIQKVTKSYHYVCEVFKLTPDQIDLSSEGAVDASFRAISAKSEEAQKLFSQDLIEQVKKYPEILEKLEISKEKDFASVVKKVRVEFEHKIQEVSKLQEEYRKVNEWIFTNMVQLISIENKDRTIGIMSDALLIAQSILTKIHEKTDIERIVEELAERIEGSIKDIYERIFPEDESFNFSHYGKGQFLSSINNEPITHPSGSQRAAISVGIMFSLAQTFGLPMILDEAFDRIDIRRLKYFCECITGLADMPSNCQLCLAGYTSLNIEKNSEVLPFVNGWKIYMVQRTDVLEKNIKQIEGFVLDK